VEASILIDARDVPLELADSRQNTFKAARTLRTVDEVSLAERYGEGGVAQASDEGIG
jgi:hypothetical protein